MVSSSLHRQISSHIIRSGNPPPYQKIRAMILTHSWMLACGRQSGSILMVQGYRKTSDDYAFCWSLTEMPTQCNIKSLWHTFHYVIPHEGIRSPIHQFTSSLNRSGAINWSVLSLCSGECGGGAEWSKDSRRLQMLSVQPFTRCSLLHRSTEG